MSQYWDIPDVFRSDSRSCHSTSCHDERRRQVNGERNFIILLTRVEQVSPSMAYPLKHRDTMPMRPVVSTPLHLSICRAVNYFRGKKRGWRRDVFLQKLVRRDRFIFIATCREMISRGYIVSRGSFSRKRGDPDHRIPNIGRYVARVSVMREIEYSVISWMIDNPRLYQQSIFSWHFFFRARTHARALPIQRLSQFFYRRVLFGVLSRVYVPAEFDGLSRRRFNACINFSGIIYRESYEENFLLMTFWWRTTRYCEIFERLLLFFVVFCLFVKRREKILYRFFFLQFIVCTRIQGEILSLCFSLSLSLFIFNNLLLPVFSFVL